MSNFKKALKKTKYSLLNKLISDNTVKYGPYKSSSQFETNLQKQFNLKKESSSQVGIKGNGDESENRRAKYRTIIQSNPDFISYINEEIEGYKKKLNECSETCLNFVSSIGDEKLKNDLINGYKKWPLGFFCNQCNQIAVSNKPITNMNEDTYVKCYEVNSKINFIVDIIYVYLLDIYTQYENGDHSNDIISKYNQIYDLSQTLGDLTQDKDTLKLFKTFQRIPTSQDELSISGSDNQQNAVSNDMSPVSLSVSGSDNEQNPVSMSDTGSDNEEIINNFPQRKIPTGQLNPAVLEELHNKLNIKRTSKNSSQIVVNGKNNNTFLLDCEWENDDKNVLKCIKQQNKNSLGGKITRKNKGQMRRNTRKTRNTKRSKKQGQKQRRTKRSPKISS